jgi:hypothetical protein
MTGESERDASVGRDEGGIGFVFLIIGKIFEREREEIILRRRVVAEMDTARFYYSRFIYHTRTPVARKYFPSCACT